MNLGFHVKCDVKALEQLAAHTKKMPLHNVCMTSYNAELMFNHCLRLHTFLVLLLLTMVVSAMEPKLLMNMLQETLTGGPAERQGGMKTIYRNTFIN